jgi:hypothetical protein
VSLRWLLEGEGCPHILNHLRSLLESGRHMASGSRLERCQAHYCGKETYRLWEHLFKFFRTLVLGTNPTSEKTRFFPEFTSCELPQNGIALHLGYVYDIYVYLKSYVQVTEVSVMLAQLLRCAEGHHRRSWIQPILLDRSGKVQYGIIGPIVITSVGDAPTGYK